MSSKQTIIYVSNHGSEDIAVFRLEKDPAKLSRVGAAKAVGPVQPTAVSPDKRFLYAAIRRDDAAVETFAIDPASGALTATGRVIPVPASITYLATDKSGRFLLGACYHGHIACVFAIGPDGLPLAEPVQVLEPGKHPHAILPDSGNRFAFLPALGSDIVVQYVFDSATGRLAPNDPPSVALPSGSGPRHFRFSPDERFVYVLTELSGEVFTYGFNQLNGRLIELHSVSIVPPAMASGDPFKMWAAEIHITPNGKFVYTTERTTSTMTCFKASPESGKLTYAGHITAESQPRGFQIDSSGDFLVAAGEKSGHVSLYAIDGKTGGLTQVDRALAGEVSNWVEMVTL